MIRLHGCLHQNCIWYYSLILSLYNVSKISGTSVPFWTKTKRNNYLLTPSYEIILSVIIHCDFCWVLLIHWIIKRYSSTLQEIYYRWYHCCYRILYRWDATYTKSKKPFLVWTTRDVVMCNNHMIYKMKSSNYNTAFIVPLIPISDSTYSRLVYEVPRYIDYFGTPSLS